MKARKILDAVHGYVTVPPSLDQVLDAPPVQRLRGICQTALLSQVYPGANGTRFEHSIGVMHLAYITFLATWDNSEAELRDAITQEVNADVPHYLDFGKAGVQLAECVAAVGLLHDIGHTPFSHALEPYFKGRAPEIFSDGRFFVNQLTKQQARAFHEVAGSHLVSELKDYFPSKEMHEVVQRIYDADPDDPGWAGAFHGIVASLVDVDRMDYLVRDSRHAGTEYGSLDLQRLLTSLEFRTSDNGRPRLSLGLRARSAAELLLVQRIQAHRWMYKHPRVVAVEALLRSSLEILDEIRGSAATDGRVRDALSKLQPRLNYIFKSSSYRVSGLSIGKFDPDAPSDNELQLELPLEIVQEDLSKRVSGVFSEIQTSINDNVVLTYCSQVAIYFRHLLDGGNTDLRLQRYLQLYDVALRRSPALILPWKRYEEYVDLASAVHRSQAARSYITQWNGLLREHLGGDRERLELARATAVSTLNDPVAFMNYVGYRLLYQKRDELDGWLEEECPSESGYSGFWRTEFVLRRDPLLATPRSIVLEGSKSLRVSLRDTSPLVAAVEAVERQNIGFYAFFVQTDHDESRKSVHRAELRGRLRDQLKEKLPVFVQHHLRDNDLGIRKSLYQMSIELDR